MKILNARISAYLSILGLAVLSIAQSHAAIVTASGVDLLDSKHYVINTAQSNLVYDPGPLAFIPFDPVTGVPTPTPQNYFLAGTFDVQIKRYWWDYQDFDSEGNLANYSYSTNWLEFSNPVLDPVGLPANFNFPKFPGFMSSATEFFGSSGPCALPMGPNTLCLGSSINDSSISGTLQGNKIVINGYQPDSGLTLSSYHYHIDATVVPVPAAVWLFISGLGLLGFRRR